MSFNQYQPNAQQQNLEDYYAAMDNYMGVAHDNAERKIADQQAQQAQQLAYMAQHQRALNYLDNSKSGKKHGRDEYRLLTEKGQKIVDPNYPGYGGKTKSKRRKTRKRKSKRRRTTRRRRTTK